MEVVGLSVGHRVQSPLLTYRSGLGIPMLYDHRGDKESRSAAYSAWQA